MSNTFKYSILKYKHTPLSEETLNLGILFIFPEDNYIDFVSPKKINRLKQAFYDVNENDIKAYLQSFNKYAARFIRNTSNLSKYQYNYDELVNEKFLIKDATSLQFTSVREGRIFNNKKDTIEYYSNLHLHYYQSEVDTSRVVKHTEAYLLSQFKKILQTKNPRVKQAISHEDLELRVEDVYFKGNYKWINKDDKSNNLVKAISFDLTERDLISDKALLLKAKLNHFSQYPVTKDVRFDLILSKPTDIKLSSDFNKALKLLKTTDANKQIIVEDNLDEYVTQIEQYAEILN